MKYYTLLLAIMASITTSGYFIKWIGNINDGTLAMFSISAITSTFLWIFVHIEFNP